MQHGELGAFVVNVGKEEISFEADVDLTWHGLNDKARGRVQQITPAGKAKHLGRFSSGKARLQATLPGRHVTLFRLQPR